jgi:choline monooxygenase
MDVDVTSREIDRFDAEAPIEEAWTPPASWYLDAGLFDRERRTVFRASWQFACALDQVREPGRYVRVDLLGESYVVLRGADGELRAFHNVCRHHAAQLLEGAGCVDKVVCPYHGWEYRLDGRLESAPRMGGVGTFDREHFGLQPVPVEVWGPFVFVHPGEPDASFRAGLETLLTDLDGFGDDDLVHVTRRRYPMQCNWKVFVDNYLDGGYHIAHVHRGLASQIELDSYRTELGARHSTQVCEAAEVPRDAHGNDFKERIGKGALYAWIYPNFMFNRYGPILDTNWVVPTGADRCEVVFDYWFPRSHAEADDEFVAQSLAASDRVQQEDVTVSESVQRGVGSSSYDRGRYAPRVETTMLHFHRLLAADLRRG